MTEPTPPPETPEELEDSLLASARRAANDSPPRRNASRSSRGAKVRRSTRAGSGDDARSGPGPDDRDPQRLQTTVDALVDERGWRLPVAIGGIAGRWEQIVGGEVAGHCQPAGFEKGVLTVQADSTAWATQVRMLGATLVRRLNEVLGDGTVTRVTVEGPGGPSWRKGRLRVPGRGPRDTYG